VPRRKEPEQKHSDQETAHRRDEWLRRSLNTPPKQHKAMVAERKAKRGAKTGAKSK
jgi:hypothetical protein